MSTERTQATPSRRVPTATWEEPPPTSQTAIRARWPRRVAAIAPMNASRPSSWGESCRTGTPDSAVSRAISSAPFRAWRPGLATSTSVRSAPWRRATATRWLTVSDVSDSLSAGMPPVRSIGSPSRSSDFSR